MGWLQRLTSSTTPSGHDQAASFLLNFEASFGATHPAFFDGDFASAWLAAHTQYRFLAIYLHSPCHQDSTIFCRDVLCQPQVSEFLSQNFIVWAGDVSEPEAYRLSNQMGVPSFPFVAVVLCPKQNSESFVRMLLHPSPEDPQLRALGVQPPRQPLVVKYDELVDAERLLAQLRRAVDNESIHLTAMRLEQEELNSSRAMREEQDQAYNEALREDEEKERKRAAAALEAEEAAALIEGQRSAREAQLSERAGRLPPEPITTTGTARVLVRTLNGGRITRKFDGTVLLRSVFDWVDVASPDPMSVSSGAS